MERWHQCQQAKSHCQQKLIILFPKNRTKIKIKTRGKYKKIQVSLEFPKSLRKKLRREGLDLHRLLALVHNSCCYATMQHLMTSFCNI